MPAETDKATAKELQRIRRLPENRVCPNCLKEENVGFGAVCTTFKTFICHDCKSAHQSFSHRCKSVQMSIWTMDEVKALDECNGGGNAAATRYFLSRLTEKERVKQGASPDAYKRFIERAYIKLRWAAEEKGGKDDAKEKKVEKEVALPKPESASPDFTEPPKEPKTKRKSRKSRRAEEGNTASLHGKLETMQKVSWHPGVEMFHNQADGGYSSWMGYDASAYPYAESGETCQNGWAWQHSGPCASYPSGPSYPGTPHEETWFHPSHSGGPSLPSRNVAAHWEDLPGSPHASPHDEKLQTGPPSVSTASPPFSAAASWSTAWSSPTAKAASLPLDSTNPWAEDVLQLCEKHGQNVAGRFDLSPAMAGRTHVPSWGETAM